MTLQWRHNERDSVSNHQPHDCLLNRLFRRRSKKTSKLHVTGLCVGNSPYKWSVTRKMFPFDDVIMKQQRALVQIMAWRQKCDKPFPYAMLTQSALRWHYNDVIMSAMVSQITSLTIIYSTVYSRRRSNKTSKLRVTGLCEGNSPVTAEFPAQMASNAENVSIWWRHYGHKICHKW